MKRRYIVVLIFLFSGILLSNSQTRSTKGAKIILVINKESNTVEHIELLANFQKKNKKQLTIAYSNHKFFLGVLKGKYSLENDLITPGNNTTIILYTEKQFSFPEPYIQGDNLNLGDEFDLGKTKAKVIANKKGELVLKTQ